MVKGALGPLTGSVWSFTAALLANPVTWVVIGIVALIAALVLLYNKCEWFREGVGAILDFFGGSLKAGLDLAGNILGALGGLIGGGLEAANAAVREKLGNMKRTYEEHGGGIRGKLLHQRRKVSGGLQRTRRGIPGISKLGPGHGVRSRPQEAEADGVQAEQIPCGGQC